MEGTQGTKWWQGVKLVVCFNGLGKKQRNLNNEDTAVDKEGGNIRTDMFKIKAIEKWYPYDKVRVKE